MGIDINRFRNPNQAEKFICSICLGVVDLKMKTVNFQHLFCQSCIEDYLQRNASYPECQAIFEVQNPPRLVKQILEELEVICKFNCGMVIKYENIEQHEATCLQRVCTVKNGCNFPLYIEHNNIRKCHNEALNSMETTSASKASTSGLFKLFTTTNTGTFGGSSSTTSSSSFAFRASSTPLTGITFDSTKIPTDNTLNNQTTPSGFTLPSSTSNTTNINAIAQTIDNQNKPLFTYGSLSNQQQHDKLSTTTTTINSLFPTTQPTTTPSLFGGSTTTTTPLFSSNQQPSTIPSTNSFTFGASSTIQTNAFGSAASTTASSSPFVFTTTTQANTAEPFQFSAGGPIHDPISTITTPRRPYKAATRRVDSAASTTASSSPFVFGATTDNNLSSNTNKRKSEEKPGNNASASKQAFSFDLAQKNFNFTTKTPANTAGPFQFSAGGPIHDPISSGTSPRRQYKTLTRRMASRQ